MKKLKFSENLIALILQGDKRNTWRINDEKCISKGDLLTLCKKTGVEFAKARVDATRLIKFCDISEEDKEGHEKFISDEEMYATYSKYYNCKVTPETEVKVIRFKLLN